MLVGNIVRYIGGGYSVIIQTAFWVFEVSEWLGLHEL
jgi:hypothetical protein